MHSGIPKQLSLTQRRMRRVPPCKPTFQVGLPTGLERNSHSFIVLLHGTERDGAPRLILRVPQLCFKFLQDQGGEILPLGLHLDLHLRLFQGSFLKGPIRFFDLHIQAGLKGSAVFGKFNCPLTIKPCRFKRQP